MPYSIFTVPTSAIDKVLITQLALGSIQEYLISIMDSVKFIYFLNVVIHGKLSHPQVGTADCQTCDFQSCW